MSESKNLHEAVLAFQAEAPTLKKDATNPHFKSKFTPLDTIVETIQPLLTKHGLTWMAFPGVGPGDVPVLAYRLTHASSGEALNGQMPLLLTKQDPQGLGSAITYARRYSLTAVLNLVADDDDDGNAGSQRQQQRQTPVRQQNDSSEYVNAEDVKALAAASKGLTAGQIRLAISSVGASNADPKDPSMGIFALVPQDKAELLAKALAGASREAAA